jgi:hypothetical protein
MFREDIYLSVYGSTSLVGLGRFFYFLICTQSVDSLDGDQPVARPLPTQNNTDTE